MKYGIRGKLLFNKKKKTKPTNKQNLLAFSLHTLYSIFQIKYYF